MVYQCLMISKAIQLGNVIFNKCTMKMEKYIRIKPLSYNLVRNHFLTGQQFGKHYGMMPEDDALCCISIWRCNFGAWVLKCLIFWMLRIVKYAVCLYTVSSSWRVALLTHLTSPTHSCSTWSEEHRRDLQLCFGNVWPLTRSPWIEKESSLKAQVIYLPGRFWISITALAINFKCLRNGIWYVFYFGKNTYNIKFTNFLKMCNSVALLWFEMHLCSHLSSLSPSCWHDLEGCRTLEIFDLARRCR